MAKKDIDIELKLLAPPSESDLPMSEQMKNKKEYEKQVDSLCIQSDELIRELKFRYISSYLINKGLEEIIEIEYLENLKHLIVAKNENLKARNKFERRQKLFQFVYRKGYESELISNILEDVLM